MRIEGGAGYRLLTEAEWEYAARGGEAGRFGATDQAGELGQFAWYAENSGNCTHEVGLKEPNAFHLHDMLGNVWEWCWDWWPASGYRGRDPTVMKTAADHCRLGLSCVLRGGCWSSRIPNRCGVHAGSSSPRPTCRSITSGSG